jgi:hypothetical protein
LRSRLHLRVAESSEAKDQAGPTCSRREHWRYGTHSHASLGGQLNQGAAVFVSL